MSMIAISYNGMLIYNTFGFIAWSLDLSSATKLTLRYGTLYFHENLGISYCRNMFEYSVKHLIENLLLLKVIFQKVKIVQLDIEG